MKPRLVSIFAILFLACSHNTAGAVDPPAEADKQRIRVLVELMP